MKKQEPMDWLDVIEKPFIEYAKKSKVVQNRIIIVIWLVSVFFMFVAGMLSLFLND